MKFLFVEESSRTDVVSLGVERGSLKKLSIASEAEMEGLRVTVGARLEYVEVRKDRLERAALETQLANNEALPDEALTEMIALRDRWQDEEDRLSSDRTVLTIELKKTRRQVIATKTENRMIIGQLSKQRFS